MNAKNLSKVGIGLTLTALALSGGLAVSTSCSGGSGSGGSAGSGSGGSGGGSGGSTSPGTCADAPTDGVNFCNGKAQGIMAGYAFIALGASDTATDPVCAEDPAKPEVTRPISAPPSGECVGGGTCPTTGRTMWKATDSLCITGSIPVVTGGDYTSNWGLQIGINTSVPPADSSGNGQTLGQVASNAGGFTHMTFTTNGTVAPTGSAIRAFVHLVSQKCTDNPYCATMQASGKAMTLTSFNTACWDGSGTALKATDIPNIDKIGIQISSDTSNPYVVTDYCLTGIQFDSN